MNNKIIVDGLSFVQSGRPYYYCSTKRLYLHRYLWAKEYGDIPEGFEIHHKDHDAANNELSNLELLTKEQHKELHMSALTDERREFMRNNLNEKARPKAIEWHKSKAGSDWHRKHYENTKDALRAEKEFVCACCATIFKSVNVGVNRFCSNKCKSKWRRLSGVDNVTKVCGYCGKVFESNKYANVTCCSRGCSNRYRSAKDSPNLRE